MASANVELVRSIYAAWSRGDFSGADWADPAIEYVMPDGPSPGTWRGTVGLHKPWRDFLGAWEDFRIEAEEYRELDQERVLVLDRFTGRGKTSGLEIGEVWAKGVNLFHVRGGKVTKLFRYYDRDRALAELGLAPEEQM